MPIPEVLHRPSSRNARGFTLLEILVVLILLGVASTLVVPAFPDLPREEKHALDEVIDAARGLAVRNASTVTLAFGPDGRWTASQSNGSALSELPGGTIDQTDGPRIRLRISPLGGCSLDGVPPTEPPFTFDPVRCRLRGADR